MINSKDIKEYMKHISYLLQKGADYLLSNLNQGVIKVDKGGRDFALDIDIALEKLYKEYLANIYPEIPFLGEELTPEIVSDEYVGLFWAVDPIDGTVNYFRGLPEYGSSIALVENGKPIVSGICFPALNEMYIAGVGNGAYLNGKRISVSNTANIALSILAFGDFSVAENCREINKKRFKYMEDFSNVVLRVRMPGTAALQLAWLASGRIDISLTLSNNSWDVQGGVLLVREAGGVVYDADGSEHTNNSKYTFASNGLLKSKVLEIVSGLE